MKSDSILEVSHMTVDFGAGPVVHDVGYVLRRGSTLGIVGESGSGKSVSSMALMGLLPPHANISGHAMLSNADGTATDLLAVSDNMRHAISGNRIAMIFQEPMTSLNPVHRCGHQVVEMLRTHCHTSRSEARQRTIELFEEVMLPRPEKIFDSYPHELSGGQKQRVMIAMALICNPDILIADEPTTALDVTVQHTIIDLLRTLQQRHGTSIIFISHDLGVVSQVADDIMVMYRGHIVEQGAAADVLHHPSEAYTRGLLACRPPLDSRPKRLPTVEQYLAGTQPDTTEQRPTLPPSATKLIEVHNLSVDYTLKRNLLGRPVQQLRAVDGISFSIAEGETLGLVGESGCGKSTLGRALLRLIEHHDGSVSYRGTPLDKLSSRRMQTLRPRLQIIFQDPYSSLNPRISIGDAILEPLLVHRHAEGGNDSRKQKTERVINLMQQVGLDPDWYSRFPHQLSGGQRQRVCIARALILKPELVVCDESVSALDVSVQAQVLNLLSDLKEQFHLTYLFITHDLSVVRYLADRIMVMQKGRMVEYGETDSLFASPTTAYTQTLIDAIPRIDPR